MKADLPAVRWIKAYWADEEVWYYFEADAEGWVLRQVELRGGQAMPVVSASLHELPDANTDGIEAVQRYEAKYGVLADQPMTGWDTDFPQEEISTAEFEKVWIAARARMEAR